MQLYTYLTQLNIPTILTLIRLICAPVIVPALLVYFLPLNIFFINILLALLFLLFSLTDFLDGYLARRYNQVTTLGKMLDPIADKFLIFSTLIALVAVGKLWFLWAIILIGREFFVMALRQLALEQGFVLQVSGYGKLKTVTHVLLIAVLIICPYSVAFDIFLPLHGIKKILILAALLSSIISAYAYWVTFLNNFTKTNHD